VIDLDDRYMNSENIQKDIKKIIDYCLEIDDYIKHLNEQKKYFYNEIKSYIEGQQKNLLTTNYAIAQIQKETNTFTKKELKKALEIIIENDLIKLVGIKEGKSLTRYLAKDSEILEVYRKYILRIDEEANKKKLVLHLISNNKIHFLNIDNRKFESEKNHIRQDIQDKLSEISIEKGINNLTIKRR
jgi:hypothetical protein